MIMQSPEKSAAIRALRSAAPYIRLYKGKTFVIKAGGAVFGDAVATRALIEQIAILHYLGIKVVMVADRDAGSASSRAITQSSWSRPPAL